jgi:hypothetical protein
MLGWRIGMESKEWIVMIVVDVTLKTVNQALLWMIIKI